MAVGGRTPSARYDRAELPLTGLQQRTLDAIGNEKLTATQIANRLGRRADYMSGPLLSLHAKGRVRRSWVGHRAYWEAA